jgi:hypothetical protein
MTIQDGFSCAGNGALTMMLGTSDEMGRTTLSGQDLFQHERDDV